jgi:hypothetical protein
MEATHNLYIWFPDRPGTRARRDTNDCTVSQEGRERFFALAVAFFVPFSYPHDN